MVNIQLSGIVAQEMFTGVYNKRVEQNKAKDAAEAYHAQEAFGESIKFDFLEMHVIEED